MTPRVAIGIDTAKRLAAAFRTTPETDSYETRLVCAAVRASRGSSVTYQEWHVAQALVVEREHWAAKKAAETERKLLAQLEAANAKLLAATTEMTREAQERALAKAG